MRRHPRCSTLEYGWIRDDPATAKRERIERRIASERRSSEAGLDCRPASPRERSIRFPDDRDAETRRDYRSEFETTGRDAADASRSAADAESHFRRE